jgi:undecaprenyl diphosphate synthase
MVFKNKTTLDMDNLPKHIAIIMDGNGRWAEKRGLSREVGHREGSRSLKKIVQAC